MRRSLFIACLLLVFKFAEAQSPEMVAPGVISNHGVFGFTLSPDGKEAFWVRSNGGRDTLVIMTSRKHKDTWSTPEAASFSNDVRWKDIDPMFSPDGKTILFQSTRPVPDKPERKGFDIWAVTRERNGWSKPFHLGNEINSDDAESFASMTKKGDIYFMKQNPDGEGSSDIYVSRFSNGTYETPENIGAPVNTAFRESNPFISPNEDYLIYFSSDSTGFGEVDLYIVFRTNNGWSTPKNLGEPINTVDAEFCPFYHERQKRLYFARHKKRASEKARLVEDIYSIDWTIPYPK